MTGRMIDDLKKLLEFESIAQKPQGNYPYGESTANAVDYVLSLCKGFGFRVKNADNKYAFAEIGRGDQLVGILVHLDVVPAGDGWSYPPFAGTEEDGNLYGRGANDNKGPAIAVIYAMKKLLDEKIELNKRFRIIFGQTEETGIWDDIKAYKEAEEVPGYGFTPDASFPAIGGERGILILKLSMKAKDSGLISIHGGVAPNVVPDKCKASYISSNGNIENIETSGKPAHGSLPWEGENAITKLMKALYEEDLESDFVKMYMELIGESMHGEKLKIDFSDLASGKLSLNAGWVKEEDEDISLYLDIRYPITECGDKITGIIRESIQGYDVSLSVLDDMKPVYMEEDGAVMQALLSAYRKHTKDMEKPMVIGGGTYARAMKNIVAFGPSFSGEPNTNHEKDEYIKISNLEQINKIYYDALYNLNQL